TNSPMEIGSPFSDSKHEGKHLTVSNTIISLSWLQLSREKGCWKAVSAEAEWSIDLPSVIKGRYIKIGLQAKEYLHLSRVEVFGWETNEQKHAVVPKLSASEAAGLQQGLLVHFPFDRASTQVFLSRSGRNIQAKAVGAKWTKDGHRRGGVEFDGRDDYLDITPLEFGSPFTVSTWVYFRSLNSWSRVMDFRKPGNQHQIVIGHVGRSPESFISVLKPNGRSAARHSFKSRDYWDQNRWIHMALTMDEKNRVVLYKNGRKHLETRSSVSVPRMKRDHAFVGKSNNSEDEFLHGIIDDFRIYNRALPPSEVERLYRLEGGSEDGR
ncbi:MAG: LamG domain-containing protein, partial [Verrucomicrobiota bacterium]